MDARKQGAILILAGAIPGAYVAYTGKVPNILRIMMGLGAAFSVYQAYQLYKG